MIDTPKRVPLLDFGALSSREVHLVAVKMNSALPPPASMAMRLSLAVRRSVRACTGSMENIATLYSRMKIRVINNESI